MFFLFCFEIGGGGSLGYVERDLEIELRDDSIRLGGNWCVEGCGCGGFSEGSSKGGRGVRR